MWTVCFWVNVAHFPRRSSFLHKPATFENLLADPAPTALLTGFGESGINLELRGWIEDLRQPDSHNEWTDERGPVTNPRPPEQDHGYPTNRMNAPRVSNWMCQTVRQLPRHRQHRGPAERR